MEANIHPQDKSLMNLFVNNADTSQFFRFARLIFAYLKLFFQIRRKPDNSDLQRSRDLDRFHQPDQDQRGNL
jgi:hypothetical protein